LWSPSERYSTTVEGNEVTGALKAGGEAATTASVQVPLISEAIRKRREKRPRRQSNYTDLSLEFSPNKSKKAYSSSTSTCYATDLTSHEVQEVAASTHSTGRSLLEGKKH